MTTTAEQPLATDFAVLRREPTRWADNDHCGHINNAVYYSLFDSAVNGWLIASTGVDIRTLPAIGIGLERVGTSSVIYRLALFAENADGTVGSRPHATGRFVHVYVDSATRRPTAVPDVIRAALSLLSNRPTSQESDGATTTRHLLSDRESGAETDPEGRHIRAPGAGT